MAIRYDKKFNTEIQKTVRNFNAKISRLEKSERDLILPEKVSIRDLKKSYTSRSDLRRRLKELDRYSIRGAEKTIITEGGLKTSIYELDRIMRETRRVKSQLTRDINRLSNIRPTVFGVEQSATYSQMGSQQLANLRAKRMSLQNINLTLLSESEFKNYLKKLEKINLKTQYRNEVFQNNYMDKMLFNLGYAIGYDNNKIETIRNKLLTLSPKQFLNLFDTELAVQAIRDWYPETHRGTVSLNSEQITILFDELYNNIDSIILDYQR